MAGIFQPIELEWQGKVYTIPAHKVMRAIAVIEEQITVPEFMLVAAGHRLSISKIAMAFGGVLRFAGARVSDDEVYSVLLPVGANERSAMIIAVDQILSMVLPPDLRKRLEEEAPVADDAEAPAGDDPGNSPATVAAG